MTALDKGRDRVHHEDGSDDREGQGDRVWLCSAVRFARLDALVPRCVLNRE